MRFKKLCHVIGILEIFPIIAAQNMSLTNSTQLNITNSTFVSSASTLAPACCFIVQDTVTEEWWQQYTTSTISAFFNLTSVTTFVTPYLTTTETNYETNVYLTSTTSFSTETNGGNPLILLNTFIQGPAETASMLNPVNGTQIVTAGVTVTSPQAFNVYTTVKIITVPAVTDTLGFIACTTLSEFFVSAVTMVENNPMTIQFGPFFYNGINEDAEAYFPTTSVFQPTATVLSLTTPFIYTPTRGARGALSNILTEKFCSPTDGQGASENYGWVPQTLVDFLHGNPYYIAQYPGLESCLAGGPTIIPFTSCRTSTFNSLPTSGTGMGEGLTSGTVVTITPSAPQAVAEQAAPSSTTNSTSQQSLSVTNTTSLPLSTATALSISLFSENSTTIAPTIASSSSFGGSVGVIPTESGLPFVSLGAKNGYWGICSFGMALLVWAILLV